MNIELIKQLSKKPEPFTPGEPLFWDDPHISTQMLKVHLDPNTDAASRNPETIRKTVDWIISSLDLKAGDALIDLGCGPGLYTTRLAERGLKVSGVDYSRNSIAYARQKAKENNLEINYRYQNYLTLEDEAQYETALLIYGDYCPLSPEQRRKLLKNVQRCLKPGGHFVLDVTTPAHRKRYGNRNSWYAVDSGFWKPGPHLVLDEGFEYPEQSIYLDQAIVIEENGKISVYRNWFQDYNRESITAELEAGGFAVKGVWNDLIGTPFTEDTEWIGIVTQRK